MTWQLQEAKQRFSELVRRALRDGPQVVTRHGEDAVVVISMEEFKRLTGERPDFKSFLLAERNWPELEIERSREPAPKVDL